MPSRSLASSPSTLPLNPAPQPRPSPTDTRPSTSLQDEVGVRLTQEDPGSADWRAMNIITQYFSRPSYL